MMDRLRKLDGAWWLTLRAVNGIEMPCIRFLETTNTQHISVIPDGHNIVLKDQVTEPWKNVPSFLDVIS